MISIPKLLPLIAALPLVMIGCTSTNPQVAFDDVGNLVEDRSGHRPRWIQNESDGEEVSRIVAMFLATNLTSHSSVSIACINNRSLQAEFESIGVSQAELAQAARLSNPEFSGSWRWPTVSPTVINQEYGLAHNFLELLMLPTRKRIAERNLGITKLRIAQTVLKLSEEVQVAFYTLQSHHQLAKRLAIIVEVNEAGADIAQRQHDAGNINSLDLHIQQALHAQSRLELAKAEAQVRSDRERLNRLLGLWGSQTAWQILDELPTLPAQEMPLENLEGIAVTRRMDLVAARDEVLAVASALKLKKAYRYVPGASIGVDAEHDLDHSWVVGPNLKLEVPIFNQSQGEIGKLESEYRRAQRKFEALAINIRSEVRQARDSLIAARDVAEYHTQILLPQRLRLLQETLQHYNAMQMSNLELLAAKERQVMGEREAIEALRDYWIARVALEQSVGGSLTREISTETAPRPNSTPRETQEHSHDHHHP